MDEIKLLRCHAQMAVRASFNPHAKLRPPGSDRRRAEYINQSDAFLEAGASIIRYDEAESVAALAGALLQEIDGSGSNRCAGKRHPHRTRSGTERSND
jgi:hypothetical protein